MDGAFLEIGPWRIAGDAALRWNVESWHYRADLLFGIERVMLKHGRKTHLMIDSGSTIWNWFQLRLQ